MQIIELTQGQADTIITNDGAPTVDLYEWLQQNVGPGLLALHLDLPEEIVGGWALACTSVAGQSVMQICFETEESALKFKLRW